MQQQSKMPSVGILGFGNVSSCGLGRRAVSGHEVDATWELDTNFEVDQNRERDGKLKTNHNASGIETEEVMVSGAGREEKMGEGLLKVYLLNTPSWLVLFTHQLHIGIYSTKYFGSYRNDDRSD